MINKYTSNEIAAILKKKDKIGGNTKTRLCYVFISKNEDFGHRKYKAFKSRNDIGVFLFKLSFFHLNRLRHVTQPKSYRVLRRGIDVKEIEDVERDIPREAFQKEYKQVDLTAKYLLAFNDDIVIVKRESNGILSVNYRIIVPETQF